MPYISLIIPSYLLIARINKAILACYTLPLPEKVDVCEFVLVILF